jgi:hypothetical protein
MPTIYDLLKGNDLRSIGKSDEVVSLVTSDPVLFDEVFNGIFHDDKVIRARCADAVEKLAKKFPGIIRKKKTILLKNLGKFEQKEVQWHIALMLGCLKLNAREIGKIFAHLIKWLNTSDGIIVKVACMQTLAEFAARERRLIKPVLDEINRQMISGSPAVKARGRRLLARLGKSGNRN